MSHIYSHTDSDTADATHLRKPTCQDDEPQERSSGEDTMSIASDDADGAQAVVPPPVAPAVITNPAPVFFRGLTLTGTGGMAALAAAVAAATPLQAPDLPWDHQTRESFKLVSMTPGNMENPWYGPWNKILNLVFKHELGFEVAPQLCDKKHPDYGLFYVVTYYKTPVFFLKMKLHTYLENMSDRASADRQMRRRFNAMVNIFKIPILYGICAFGPEFAMYRLEYGSNRIHPRRRRVHRDRATDTAPVDWWHYDVMTLNGETKLMKMAARIANMLPAALSRL